MLGLTNALEILYVFIGMLFAAGAGALMLMFAFMQIMGRVAGWLDVLQTYKERKALAQEVLNLKATIDTLVEQGSTNPNEPLVKAIDVSGGE